MSARLDGESEPVPARDTDQHLERCLACRAWQEHAVATSRALRVRKVTAVPDLTAAIVASAPALRPGRHRWLRPALAGVALAQLTLALTQILGLGTSAHRVGHHAMNSVASHLFNESTSWNLALGIGLLWAAWRPRSTTGLIPVLSGFIVLLFAYSAHDLITGAAPVSRVLGHGLLVVGLALLIVLHRTSATPDPGRGDVRIGAAGKAPDEPTHPSRTDGAEPRPRRSLRARLWPVGRRRAA
ncbi:hypothetical protein [Longimycelium tulufanense]|uniref:hypothetical protein n=1 Tax=Longimycelium tulufanense TaxID=907463 RepID=UPI001665932D|nr:hypothetical protein [Longimycelium tulufanense]